ncbi:MAG: tyrosine-type recombinase/integrase [Melioribacteraceae bacterium]|nr:tyrosine-type recombinase/integrase [Melioribacteraceae bacterium]
MALQLPKGLMEISNHIYIRYYDPKIKKSVKITTGFPAKREYIKLAKELREVKIKEARQQSKYNIVPLQSRSLSAILPPFFDSREIKGSTKDIYDRAINDLLEILGDKRITEYSEDDFYFFNKQLTTKREFSKNTVAIYSRHLKAIFEYFTKKRYIPFNPVPRIVGEKKDIVIIPKDDIQAILNKLKEIKNVYGYDLVKFLYLSGLRIGEAIGLKWSNLDIAKKLMIFQNFKGNRQDVLPINPLLLDHINDMLTRKFSEEKVFIYSNISCAFFYRVQRELWGESRYSFHHLRKAFITAIALESQELTLIKGMARHSSVQTSFDYYTLVQASQMGKRLEAMTLDSLKLTK